MKWQEGPSHIKTGATEDKIELRRTDPAVLELLEQKARKIADIAASQEHFTDEEIHQMALILAQHAESQGEPLDEEVISSPSFESRIIDALDARNKMRGGSKTYIIPNDGGTIGGQISSAVEAQKRAGEEREAA